MLKLYPYFGNLISGTCDLKKKKKITTILKLSHSWDQIALSDLELKKSTLSLKFHGLEVNLHSKNHGKLIFILIFKLNLGLEFDFR